MSNELTLPAFTTTTPRAGVVEITSAAAVTWAGSRPVTLPCLVVFKVESEDGTEIAAEFDHGKHSVSAELDAILNSALAAPTVAAMLNALTTAKAAPEGNK